MKTSIQILFVCFENVIKVKPYAILQGETSKKKKKTHSGKNGKYFILSLVFSLHQHCFSLLFPRCLNADIEELYMFLHYMVPLSLVARM